MSSRTSRGDALTATPGCGQASRPPHPAGIVGQNGCGTLRRRKNVRFCGDSYPAASTCFRDRGSSTANSAADDPRSQPGPLKRGEMSRLPVRFAPSGAAIPHLTHNLGAGLGRRLHRQAGQRKNRLGTSTKGKPIHVSKISGLKDGDGRRRDCGGAHHRDAGGACVTGEVGGPRSAHPGRSGWDGPGDPAGPRAPPAGPHAAGTDRQGRELRCRGPAAEAAGYRRPAVRHRLAEPGHWGRPGRRARWDRRPCAAAGSAPPAWQADRARHATASCHLGPGAGRPVGGDRRPRRRAPRALGASRACRGARGGHRRAAARQRRRLPSPRRAVRVATGPCRCPVAECPDRRLRRPRRG